jgi:hypothetical protein
MVALSAATSSTTSAFLAPSENRIRLALASQQSMSNRIHPVSMMLGNKEDPTDVMARVDAIMIRDKRMHAVETETSDTNYFYFASTKPEYTMPQAVGYTPQKTKSLLSMHNETAVHRVAEMLNSESNSAEVMARVNQMLSSSLASAPPAKKWTSPVGYVPPAGRADLSNAPTKIHKETIETAVHRVIEILKEADAAPRSSAPNSNACDTGVSWQPYGGYEPKRNKPATPAPAAPLPRSSGPAATTQMSSGMYRECERARDR